MKPIWTLASPLILLLLCASVTAQTYLVRITYNTNLRASHSADSAIIETAPAGSTLSVIGSAPRWLKINRNGREVWMANWVSYERVEAAMPASDIDNCCFVNRQCQSDADWVSGYYAFQRNECPISAPTSQISSPQPVSSEVSQVDNCCFLGWQCQSDAEWRNGYWAYKAGQCGGSPATSAASGGHGSLVIEGSETFHIWVNKGLELLRTKAPQWYSYVIGAMRKIKQLPPATGAGVNVHTETHETAWDSNDYPNALNIFTIAHEMIHEACHIYQFRAGNPNWKPETPWVDELECVQKELEAAQLFDPYDQFGRHADWRQIINNIEDPATWWW